MTETKQTADVELRDRMVALTRDLVIIPSTSSRPSELERCYQFVRNHLDAIDGIQVLEYRSGDYPSLVALPVGCSEPEVLLCAHQDVVGLPEEASYRTHLADGRIYGPGAGDMKGQLTILLELFHVLHHRYPGIPLGIAVTSDEEIGGQHGIGHLLDEAGLRCAQAIIPDGGALNEVTVEEKGILHARLTASGHDGHAARPWLAANALDRIAVALSLLRERFAALATDDPEHWYPTCTPTVFSTPNSTVNRIPGHAEVLVDVRFPPPHTMESMLHLIRTTVGDSIDVQSLIGDEPTHLAPDPVYLECVQEITGKPVRQARESGGSDARFFSRHGIPVIMGRPEVGNLHCEDEWIDIASMIDFYHICERYLTRRLAPFTA